MTKLITKEFLKLTNDALKEKLSMNAYLGDYKTFKLDLNDFKDLYIKYVAYDNLNRCINSESVLYRLPISSIYKLHTIDFDVPINGINVLREFDTNLYYLEFELPSSFNVVRTVIFVGSITDNIITNLVKGIGNPFNETIASFTTDDPNWVHTINQPTSFGIKSDSVEYYINGKIFDTIEKSLKTSKLDHDVSFNSNAGDVSVISSPTSLDKSNVYLTLSLNKVNQLDPNISYNSIRVNQKGQVIDADITPSVTAYESEDHEGIVKVSGVTSSSPDVNTYFAPIVVNSDNEIFADMYNYPQEIHRYSVMPDAEDHKNKIVQYIGLTTSEYTQAFFYISKYIDGGEIRYSENSLFLLPGDLYTRLDSYRQNHTWSNGESMDEVSSFTLIKGEERFILSDTDNSSNLIYLTLSDLYDNLGIQIKNEDSLLNSITFLFSGEGRYKWKQINVLPSQDIIHYDGLVYHICAELSDTPNVANGELLPGDANHLWIYMVKQEGIENNQYVEYLSIPITIEGVITYKWEVLGEFSAPDLSNYYTKTEIDNKGFLTEHLDISNKASLTYVNSKLNEKSPIINEGNLIIKKSLTNGTETISVDPDYIYNDNGNIVVYTNLLSSQDIISEGNIKSNAPVHERNILTKDSYIAVPTNELTGFVIQSDKDNIDVDVEDYNDDYIESFTATQQIIILNLTKKTLTVTLHNKLTKGKLYLTMYSPISVLPDSIYELVLTYYTGLGWVANGGSSIATL